MGLSGLRQAHIWGLNGYAGCGELSGTRSRSSATRGTPGPILRLVWGRGGGRDLERGSAPLAGAGCSGQTPYGQTRCRLGRLSVKRRLGHVILAAPSPGSAAVEGERGWCLSPAPQPGVRALQLEQVGESPGWVGACLRAAGEGERQGSGPGEGLRPATSSLRGGSQKIKPFPLLSGHSGQDTINSFPKSKLGPPRIPSATQPGPTLWSQRDPWLLG